MKKKVRIEETGGTLRLRRFCQGKRYSLSNGDRDNALGRGMAQHTAAQIVNDIESGYFDESLVKYRRRTIGPKPTEINIPELIREFAAFKLHEGDIGQRSLETRYEPLAIARYPGESLYSW